MTNDVMRDEARLPLPWRERAGVRGLRCQSRSARHGQAVGSRSPLTLTLSPKGRGDHAQCALTQSAKMSPNVPKCARMCPRTQNCKTNPNPLLQLHLNAAVLRHFCSGDLDRAALGRYAELFREKGEMTYFDEP